MEISPYKFNQPGGDPKPDYIHVAPCPDVYGGMYKDKDYPNGNMADIYTQPIRDVCEQLTSQGKGLAGFIAESLQSCGGQIIPPEGYFKAVYETIRNAGGVCIADEVQVGFARVGTHYWAFETQGVVPDIVTVAKPMGNGHPVGAVVTTQEIAEAFYNTGVAYFNTYGGNPVSCAIANAVMRVIDEEGLQENARSVGEYLLKQCREFKYEFDIVGDVRGIGLFVGMELVKNRATREPDTKSAHWVVNRMKDVHRILVSSDGPNDNVIKLKPPMCFNQENADEFLLAFRECLSLLEKQRDGDILPPTNAMASTTSAATVESMASKTQIFERQEHLIKSV